MPYVHGISFISSNQKKKILQRTNENKKLYMKSISTEHIKEDKELIDYKDIKLFQKLLLHITNKITKCKVFIDNDQKR